MIVKPSFLLLKKVTLVESFYSVNYVNVNYSVKYLTVDCKYLLFLQDFFFRLKPKQYKKCQYSWLLKKNIWKLMKNKVNIYNQRLNFWLNNRLLHNWRSRKPQLKVLFINNIKLMMRFLTYLESLVHCVSEWARHSNRHVIISFASVTLQKLLFIIARSISGSVTFSWSL